MSRKPPYRMSNGKYQISISLEPEDVEAIKALSVVQEENLTTIIVNLMRESLVKEKYQNFIQAYKQFKSSLE
jgi:mevalonate pyrophosphate decarboxylase